MAAPTATTRKFVKPTLRRGESELPASALEGILSRKTKSPEMTSMDEIKLSPLTARRSTDDLIKSPKTARVADKLSTSFPSSQRRNSLFPPKKENLIMSPRRMSDSSALTGNALKTPEGITLISEHQHQQHYEEDDEEDPNKGAQGDIGTPPPSRRQSSSSGGAGSSSGDDYDLPTSTTTPAASKAKTIGKAMRRAEASITGFMAPLATFREGYLTRVGDVDAQNIFETSFWVILYEGVLYGMSRREDDVDSLADSSEVIIPVAQVKKVDWVRNTERFTISVLFEDVDDFKLSPRILEEGQDARFGSLVDISFEASTAVDASGWVADLSCVSKGLAVQNGATKAARKGLDEITSFSNKFMSSWKSLRERKASTSN